MEFSDKEYQLRKDMCEIAGMMYAKGFIGGPAGNISARLDEERFLMTPSIFFKHRLQPEQLIVVDGEGKKVGPETEATKGLNPTSEVPMHTTIYRKRPDVNGIVHAHPSCCVALTAAGKDIRPHVMTESMLFLGDIAVAEYATPTTVELGENVGKVVTDSDCVILPYHGAIVAGRDMWDACAKLEVLEQAAEICCLVNQMGGEKPLANEYVADMLRLRDKMGMSMPGDKNLLK